MKIISCDNCGVVLDKDKIEFPPMYDEEDEYEMIMANVVWDDDKFVAITACPVCHDRCIREDS